MFLSKALDYCICLFPKCNNVCTRVELGFVVIFHNSQLRELNEISIALRFSYS